MVTRFKLMIPTFVLSLALVGCKDGDPGLSDGEGGGPSDVDSANGDVCNEDEECDDLNFCNGAEQCVRGFCQQNSPIECDDDIPCTVDRCVERTRSCENALPDADADGSFDLKCTDKEGNVGSDCDDDDPESFPGNTEVCDAGQRDEDCDPTTLGFRDADNDGYLDAQCCNPQPNGKLKCEKDCDDHKANVNPESPEVCDFLDNDCNDDIDEGVSVSMFPDTDHDAHGKSSVDPVDTCPGAVGYASISNDCDDEDPEVFLGQFEICDDKDNNCDGNADEVEEYAPWYRDTDKDTYGDPDSKPVFSCYRVNGRVLSQNDCDDQNKKVSPNATETCDALDNDCNGLADYKLAGVNDFEDDDNDGVPDAECDGGIDCNDTDPRTGEGKEEVCDHVDNDCDGDVDEQTVQNIWYIDEDGDGWGVVLGSALASCEPIPARAAQFGDCDDSDSVEANGIHPGATEYCDGVDQDCDGTIDEGASVHCKADNALSTCQRGRCEILTCVPGFTDSALKAGSDCDEEVDLSTLPPGIGCTVNSDCNDGNLCTGVETCHEGFCRAGAAVNCELLGQVLQGDVVISNGLDIKALEEIELITGDVLIDGTLLSSLAGLEALKTIGGNLTITNNTNLKKLSGSALSNLEIVGGSITVDNNAALTSVDLPSLVSAGAINITFNPALLEITGYANLALVEDHIKIEGNAGLTTLSGFGSLERIGGQGSCAEGCYLPGEGGLDLIEQMGLSEMTAFESLSTVEGGIYLREIAIDVLNFPELTDAGDGFEYDGWQVEEILLPKLEHCIQFSITDGTYNYETEQQISGILQTVSVPQLRVVEDRIGLSGVTVLEALEFPELVSANFVYIVLDSTAQELKTIALPKLRSAEYLSIQASQSSPPQLATIDLSSLESVGSELRITTAIPSLAGDGLLLGSLTEVGEGSGYLTLCTGSDPQNTGTFVNDSCEVLQTLVSASSGIIQSSCGQCTISE
jgi:hypothetical protein